MTTLDAPRRRPLWLRIDWLMLLAAAGLLAYGVLFVRSACAVRTGAVQFLWLKMLSRWIPLGIAAHVAIASIDWRRWLPWSLLPWLAAVALLALVLVPGLGSTSNMGARRWLFGVFQPAEAAKIAVVPMAALVLSRRSLAGG
ncbi:MAG: FtsW/RodA/SpoVE family cell cycle protein, partial [Kiritimatiellae bacterium]|nr:FtsW/RodA/SpoVE family cell cycle protein [Kiritimatiellia bacterium]